MSNNRINPVSISNEGPRQTPNQSFGLTLSKTLAQGTAGAMGLASPILGAINPVLSAPVTQGAQVLASFAASGAAVPRATLTGTGVPATATSGSAGSTGEASLGASSNSDSMALIDAQKAMNDQSQQFNMMYLQLQDSMQRESREYQTISNIMKVRHDSAKAAINNIH
jgi:hypothetical protein